LKGIFSSSLSLDFIAKLSHTLGKIKTIKKKTRNKNMKLHQELIHRPKKNEITYTEYDN